MILITAKRDGFRRCGIAHSSTRTQYDDGFWSPEQLAELQAEPMLIVDVITEATPDELDNVFKERLERETALINEQMAAELEKERQRLAAEMSTELEKERQRLAAEAAAELEKEKQRLAKSSAQAKVTKGK